MQDVILITVSGEDKPGLSTSLLGVLAQYEAKILDIGQAVIHSTLSLGILTQVPEGVPWADVARELLFRAYELDLKIKFRPITIEEYNEWTRAQGKDRHIITLLGAVLGANHMARLTGIIRDHDLNIDVITRLSGRIPLEEDVRPTMACVEVSVRGTPRDTTAMRGEFLALTHEMGVDIAFQVDDIFRRNRRLVVFDMDSTLVQAEAIDEMAAAAGVSEIVASTTAAAMAGEIDFAPAAFTNLPVALEKGIKLRGIVGYLGSHFNSSVSDNNVGILVRPGSGIKTINDLRGKKVGVAFGTTGDLYFLGVLKRAGMSKNDVTRINVRPPSHVSTLDSGGVDAMVAWEPNITRALDKIKGSTLLLRGGGYVCFCADMHGKPEFVYEDRKRTQAFVDAMAEAAHFLRDPNNIKEVAEIGARFVRGMSPALVERTLKFVVFDARIGGGTKAAFNSSVKLLIAAKKMKRPFDAAKYLDTSFIDSTIRRHPEWFSDLK